MHLSAQRKAGLEAEARRKKTSLSGLARGSRFSRDGDPNNFKQNLRTDGDGPTQFHPRKTVQRPVPLPFNLGTKRPGGYKLSCDLIHGRVAGFARKIPLKLSRNCRKTSTQSTAATRAGAMVSGESVMWNARML